MKCTLVVEIVRSLLWLFYSLTLLVVPRQTVALVLANQPQGLWTWIGGSNHSNQKSVVNSALQYPGARQGGAVWVDVAGSVWTYGGEGFVERKSGLPKALEDLWILSLEQMHWKLLGPSVNTSFAWPPSCHGCIACSFEGLSVLYMGDNKADKIISNTWLYNMLTNEWSPLKTKNKPINGTMPKPRQYPAYWCDTNKGVMWMFGGSNLDREPLQDMWKFTIKKRKWEEVTVFQTGTKLSLPLGRFGASAWLHPSGDLYLFGGKSSSGSYGFMADLWVFSDETQKWKNLSTNANKEGLAGAYGTLGVPSQANSPGGRKGGATWVDATGHLWLFGGSGYDENAKGILKMSGLLSDLWLYNISMKMWSWVGGSKRGEGMPSYGIKGKAAVTNIPGPREHAVTFKHKEQFYMFGGGGHDVSQRDGLLNDLWVFRPHSQDMANTTCTKCSKTLPGDTINLPFVYKFAISLAVAFMAIVFTLAVCYRKECSTQYHKTKRQGCKVKYEPVKVKMQMQVPSVSM